MPTAPDEMQETVIDTCVGRDIIRIGDDVLLQVQPHFSGRLRSYHSDEVKVMIEAPRSVRIHRTEKQHGRQ